MKATVYVYVQSKVNNGFQFIPFDDIDKANNFIDTLMLKCKTLDAWIFDFNK